MKGSKVVLIVVAMSAIAVFAPAARAHHHYRAYGYGAYGVAPASAVSAQGIGQFLPLIQMGLQLLDSGMLNQFSPNPQNPKKPAPPTLPTVPDDVVKKIDDDSTKLDQILKDSKAINPNTTK